MPLGTIQADFLQDGNNNVYPMSTFNKYTFFRNRLINGEFNIWQRGIGPFASATYCADRWMNHATTNCIRSADVPNLTSQYSIEITNTGLSYPQILQAIEAVNCRDMAGNKVTLSFWAKNVGGSAPIGVLLRKYTSYDTPASRVDIQAYYTNNSPSGNWTYYQYTYDVPADAINGLEVVIFRTNASASTTRITAVQLELGSDATPYEQVPAADELIRCRRYFYSTYQQYDTTGVLYSPGTPNMNHGVFNIAIGGWDFYNFGSILLPVHMRTWPTTVAYNISNGARNACYRGNDGYQGTPLTGWAYSNNTLRFAANGNYFATNYWYSWHFTCDAEL